MLSLAVPTADGNGAAGVYPGGGATLAVYGTWDSGTVTIEVSYDGGTTWLAAANSRGETISLTADGYTDLWFGGAPQIRAVLAGSSGSTSLAAEIASGFAATREREF